jgi:hypothetical protein
MKVGQNGYPTQHVVKVNHTLWDSEKTLLFIKGRIHAHENPSPCTDEEKWCKFRVVKEGKARALKRADTREEAYQWISANVHDNELSMIEVKPTAPNRCTHYCNVNSLCEFWQEYSKYNT